MSQELALKLDEKELEQLNSAEAQLKIFERDYINAGIMQKRSLQMVEKLIMDISQIKQALTDKYGELETVNMSTGEFTKKQE